MAADGTSQGIRFDPELLYVASLFHDFGLVPEFDSHTISFEKAGGHVARVFAAGAGWTTPLSGRRPETQTGPPATNADRRSRRGSVLARTYPKKCVDGRESS
jgi:hypothetical protein